MPAQPVFEKPTLEILEKQGPENPVEQPVVKRYAMAFIVFVFICLE
jgi:hypothetical protein